MEWISGMISQLARHHPFMPFGKLIENGKNNFCLELDGIDGIEIQAIKTYVDGGAVGIDFRVNSGSLGLIEEVVDTLVRNLGKPFILEFELRASDEVVYLGTEVLSNGQVVANVIAEYNHLSGYDEDIVFSCAVTWLK